jgi:hypothetical protein
MTCPAGPGYLTSLPGTRESLFYNPATASPAVVATDEANKDTATAAELASSRWILGAGRWLRARRRPGLRPAG